MVVGNADLAHLQSASAGSSGGAITGSGITTNVKNNVWTDVDATERVTGGVEYRKTFWKNNHGTDSMTHPIAYCPSLPSNITQALGLGFNSSSDDDPAQGNMTAFGASAKVALVSDGTDARVATIVGLDGGGVPVSENVTLTNASEVLSVATFSRVWHVRLASTSGSRTVTVKQGSGGSTRGLIGPNKLLCWLWLQSPGPTTASGMKLPDLAAGQSYGFWRSLTWIAGATQTRPDGLTFQLEES